MSNATAVVSSQNVATKKMASETSPQTEAPVYNRGLFEGATINIREESDIEKLVDELYKRQQRKNVGRGMRGVII